MKPEYVGVGNFDTNNYVYAYCKCPLSTDYAIKWPLIKDGKPHRYSCTCEDCGTEVGVIAKSYGPEVYKEMEMKAIKTAADASEQPYDEFGFFDPFSVKKKESNDCISRQAVLDLPRIKTHNHWGNVIKESVDIEDVRQLPPVTPAEKVGQWIYEGYYKCSECGKTTYSHKTNYCPNCGAKMGGDAE